MKILPLGEDDIARRGSLVILYEGKDISKDIADSIINCVYRDSINEFDTIDLTLEDKKGLWMGCWFPQRGDKIQIKYKLTNWEEKGIVEHNIGTFYIDNIDYSGPPSIVSLKGISVDIVSNIMDEKKCRSWEDVTIKKIAEDIAKNSNLKLITDFKFNRIYKRVEQKLESDYTLLKRLCREAGITVKLYSDKLILFEESLYEAKNPCFKFSNKIENYSFSMDDADTYSGCKISYYDYVLDKKIEHTFYTKQRPDYKKNTQRLLFMNYDASVPGKTQQEKKEYLLKIAQRELREKNKTGITCSLTIIGTVQQLSASDIVEIDAFGRFNGKYIITEITTDYSDYSHSVNLRKCLEGY